MEIIYIDPNVVNLQYNWPNSPRKFDINYKVIKGKEKGYTEIIMRDTYGNYVSKLYPLTHK